MFRNTVEWCRRVFRALVDLEVVDRSMALAGQGFAALLPLLILLGALARSEDRDAVDTLIKRLKLSGDRRTRWNTPWRRPRRSVAGRRCSAACSSSSLRWRSRGRCNGCTRASGG